MKTSALFRPLTFLMLMTACLSSLGAATPRAAQWQEIELSFEASRDRANAYVEVDAWVDFHHADGSHLRRPMFWDGGRTFRVRFASTRPSGRWTWRSASADGDQIGRAHV